MTGVIYVTYVLCIERFNTCGRFTSARWKELFILFKKRVSTINIYSFNIKEMEDTFIGNRYNILNPIDDSNSLYGYEILNVDENVLNTIKDYQYSINDGIQFVYFFQGKHLLADFQIEDWNNFVLLYLNIEDVQLLRNVIISLNDNKEICNKYVHDISRLSENEWEAL